MEGADVNVIYGKLDEADQLDAGFGILLGL